MAKKTITAQRGALTRLANERGLTLSQIAELRIVDRKTLKKIDDAKPVKDVTLQRIADRLKTPISHFTERSSASTSDHLTRIDLLGADEVVLQPLDEDRIKDLLASCGRIRWHLDLDSISTEAVIHLEELETSVEALRKAMNFEPLTDEESHTLKSQLRMVKALSNIGTKLTSLNEHGLGLLGGSYLHWTRSDHYGVYDRSPSSVEYTSAKAVLIGVFHSKLHSKRVVVAGGDKPPPPYSYDPFYGPRVSVSINGRTTWEPDFD